MRRATLVEATIDTNRAFPRALIEAAAKTPPCFLLREVAVIYRCPFCRKSWRASAKRRAERHLRHCFERPDRTPYLGELSYPFMHQFSAWYPGSGKIWDGRAWANVPGIESDDGSELFRLDQVKPWWRRLEVLGYDFDELIYEDGPTPSDEDIIRAIHGETRET